MRVFLKVLHLPIAELRQAVNDELEKNPILEESARETTDELPPANASQNNSNEISDDETSETIPDDLEDKEPLVFTERIKDFSRPKAEDVQKIRDFQESLITRPESLFDFLEWQLHFIDLKPIEKKVAAEILGNIDSDGYLKVTVDEIMAACDVDSACVQKVLEEIQKFDPPGVGARDLREALLIQLTRKGSNAALAKQIVSEHLSLIAKHDLKNLAKIYSASEEDIKAAIDLVSRLDPKPGRSFYAEENIVITPDATVSIKDGTDDELEIEVHQEWLPELKINKEYRRMIRQKDIDDETKGFLKEKLASGMEFLKAIELRGSTLKTITDEVVRAQPLFFTRGFSFLRPLRLKDIAERLGLHESTISRAIHGKYLKTPQGTIPYKSFFSQKIETETGDVESQKSIMERIKSIVEKEDSKHPLSDQKIEERLKAEGIVIARRTIAKYRKILRILPIHLRRQR